MQTYSLKSTMYRTLFLLCAFGTLFTVVFCDESIHKRYCEHSDPDKVVDCVRDNDRVVVGIIARACVASLKAGLPDHVARRQFICGEASEEQFEHYSTCFKAGVTAAEEIDPGLVAVIEECLNI